MFTVDDIANWFLTYVDRDAGDSITHLKLQKLVYYAQAWSLALHDEALFEEEFQAWTHGPVLCSLFDRFAEAGWSALPAPESGGSVDEKTHALLNSIAGSYGELSARRLEDLTHSEEPWIVARGGLPLEERSDAVISKEGMKKYYKERLERQRSTPTDQGAADGAA